MTNSLITRHGELLADTQSFRPLMLSLLEDGDLAFALPGNMTLGELCRQMGEIEHGYIASFSRFEHDWTYRHTDPKVATRLTALRDWYAQLDAALWEALEALTDDDLKSRRVRSGGWATLEKEFHLYREALLIFYAKAGIYLRALKKDLPEIWIDWIG